MNYVPKKSKVRQNKSSGGNLGFEKKPWQAAAVHDFLLPKLISGEMKVKD